MATESKPPGEEPRAPSAGTRRRKPYEPPRIVSREPLEAMAATCTRPFGKASGVCSTGRS